MRVRGAAGTHRVASGRIRTTWGGYETRSRFGLGTRSGGRRFLDRLACVRVWKPHGQHESIN